MLGSVWWRMLVIPALEKQRPKETEFEAILGYIAGSHLKKKGERSGVGEDSSISKVCVIQIREPELN